MKSGRLVLLLGMHRSGTSLAARAFADAGLPMGNALLRSSQPDNLEGYWEDVDIVLLQSEVEEHLARKCAVTSPWDAATLAWPEHWESDTWQIFGKRFLETLNSRFSDTSVFGFKDPRTARLIPLWIRAAEIHGVKASGVQLVRRPAEVSASLARRNGFSFALGEAFWLRWVRNMLWDGQVIAEGVLPYEAWWSDPAAAAEQVCGLVRGWSEITDLNKAPQVLNPELRHHFKLRSPVSFFDSVYERFTQRSPAVLEENEAMRLVAEIENFVMGWGGWRCLPSAIAPLYSETEQPLASPRRVVRVER